MPSQKQFEEHGSHINNVLIPMGDYSKVIYPRRKYITLMPQQQIKLLCGFIYFYCIALQKKLIYIFFWFNDNIHCRP